MTFAKRIRWVFGMLLSLVALFLLGLGVVISAHEPGYVPRWHWFISVPIGMLPFWFCFGIVYSAYCDDEMMEVDILCFPIKLEAFKRALWAESLFLIIFAFFIVTSVVHNYQSEQREKEHQLQSP